MTETFTLDIDGKTVNVEHEGEKPFSQMPEDSQKFLRRNIEADLFAGKTEGFYPYNNFEYGVEWTLVN
jgi:hypothetical protein